MTPRKWALVFTAISALVILALLMACGGSNGGSKSLGSVVNVTLSDPSTCAAPKGPFSHIFVTIMDVQVHTSAMAGDNDPGWQTAIPNTQGTPQQVDLLGIADNDCFLKTLGSTTQLQPGSYQQIRVILADDAHQPAQNACKTVSNCVMLTNDPNPLDPTPHPLLLSSETRTGIKIPPGQIAGGKFVIDAGQTRDLNLDFNACASIVTQGNGAFRLKPVMHAGEVTLTANSINGTIVDATSQPITNGNIIVALETNENGTEVVKRQTTADASGHFAFCPVDDLGGGTYDVVAVAFNSSNTAFAMTITTGVTPGTALGNVKMFPAGAAASITGLVTSSQPGTPNPSGTAVDVALSALQTVGSVNFIVPLALQGGVVVPITTEQGQSCPANTFCKSYSMSVPAAPPTMGAFSATGTNYVQGSGDANYLVNAQAVKPQSGGTPFCSPSSITKGPVTVTAGQTTNAPQIDFTGCQ